MSFQNHRLLPAALCVALALSGLAGCDDSARAERQTPIHQVPALQPTLISSQRTGRLPRFPCSDCHRMISASGTSRAYVAEHRDLRFAHFEAIEHCALCHDPQDMDHLKLLDGSYASFDAAERVCGQCHGEKLRDFRIGAHGKLMGSFRGVKYRYVCTDCHNAHAPERERMTARPAPPFPTLGIPKGTHR